MSIETTAHNAPVGRIFYVGPNGSDDNDGARHTPFATIGAIAKDLQPGDTVYYLEGTYRNPTYGDGNIWKESQDTVIRLNNVHGTAEAPITIAAEPGADVKFQYDGGGAVTLRGSSHIIVDGFDMEGPASFISKEEALDAQWTYRVPDSNGDYIYKERDDEFVRDADGQVISSENLSDISNVGAEKPIMFTANAISLPNGSHNITIQNNAIHHAAANAIAATGGNDYISILNNDIYNNTWITSNGTHGISFKFLDSIDDNDDFKIIVEGNRLTDNYNLLVSWVPTKTLVTRHIDEAKPLHIQDNNASTGWDHGRILVADNLVVRSGNTAVTVNDADRVTIANNTFVDGGYINTLIAQDADPDSPYFQFFSRQYVEDDNGDGIPDGVSAGGFRLAGGNDIEIFNNIVSLSDPDLLIVDASASVDATNTTVSNNIYEGGNGLRVRSERDTPGAISAGFAQVDNVGFTEPASGDYTLSAGSVARNAGVVVAGIGADIDGNPRSDGQFDIGAFEFQLPSATIIGDDADNVLRGTREVDGIDGGAGDDRILGLHGNDTIAGGDGNDEINAGSGNDIIDGGAGNDRISGRGGNDDLTGGAGNDVFLMVSDDEGHDVIRDFTQGEDVIDVRLADINSLDDLTIDTASSPGDTVISYGTSLLTLAGFTGSLNPSDFLFLNQGTGDPDVLQGNSAANTFFGGDGDDKLYGRYGDDVLNGGGDNDSVIGGRGNDVLDGEAGNDWLNGGQDDDVLVGGVGRDVLSSIGGNVTLTGGALAADGGAGGSPGDGERDVFAVTNAHERTVTITDFEQGVDVINLRSFGVTDPGAEIAQTVNGGDRVLEINDTTIVLDGLAGVTLSTDDMML